MSMKLSQPIDDTLQEERLAFAELAADLASKRLVENLEENDKYPFGELFTDAIKDAGEVGFYGVNLDSDHGGVDMRTDMVAVILEQLSMVDASLAGVVFTNAAALEIINHASIDVKHSGAYDNISSLGSTPIAFQSFLNPVEEELPIVDDGGLISGSVRYLTLGGISDYALIPAVRNGAAEFSYYLVNLKNETIIKSKPIVSLGLHACPGIDIDMKKTPATLIGAEGRGRTYFEAMLNAMSLCSAAMSLGVMKGSYGSAQEYTTDRYQGGRQIIDWTQVRMMLANMAIEAKAGEALLNRACQERANDLPDWEFTARSAAIHIGELAIRSTADGVQLFGGNGYMKDYPQEKRMRDARQIQGLLGMAAKKKIDYIADYLQKYR